MLPLVAGSIGGMLGKGLNILDGIKNMFPAYEEETVVAVHGNAYSTKADLFKQAIAIAFGQNRRANFLQGVTGAVVPLIGGLLTYNAPFYLQADYDMMGKSVTVTLRYMYNGMFSQPAGALADSFIDRFFRELPSENLSTDAPSGFWFSTLGSEYKKTFHPNQMIATGEAWRVNGVRLQGGVVVGGQFPGNPVPGEGTSQAGVRGGSYLEELVFALLAKPCEYNSAWQVPNNGQLETSPTDPTLTGYVGPPIDGEMQGSSVPPSTSSLLNQGLQSALRNGTGIGFGAGIGSAISNGSADPSSLTHILQSSLNMATGGLSNLAIDFFNR